MRSLRTTTREEPPVTATRESSGSGAKTQCNQKVKKKEKICFSCLLGGGGDKQGPPQGPSKSSLSTLGH